MADAISNNPTPGDGQGAAAGALESGGSSDPSNPATPPKTVEELEQELAAANEKLAKSEKSYKEAQGLMTKATTGRAELQRQFDALQEQQNEIATSIAAISEGQVDPEVEMETFRKQPKRYIATQVQGQIEKVRRESKKEAELAREEAFNANVGVAVLQMNADTENYPDFAEVYPEMVELQKAGRIQIDRSVDTPRDIVERLYNSARSSHGPEAASKARELGRKEAEAEAAREAASTVPGGGKPSSVSQPDLQKMPLADLEKYVEANHGVAER